MMVANRSKATYCIVIPLDRYFQSLKILSEGELLQVFHAGRFGPVFPIDHCNAYSGEISLDNGIKFRFRLNSCVHEENFSRFENRQLMMCFGICWTIRDLTKHSFSSRNIDES